MFGWSRDRIDPLDGPIKNLTADMQTYGPETKEYATMLAELERLYSLKADQRRRKVSPDVLAGIVGNIIVVLVIVSYEHGHVMASRAKEYILKPK